MELQLRHGDLNVTLLVCNKSYTLAVIQTEEESGNIDGKSVLKNHVFISNYIYQSYAVYCRRNKITQDFDFIDFDEALSLEAENSNYVEVFEQVANSIVSMLNAKIEDLKKKEQISHKPTTKSKRSTAVK